MGWPGGGYFAGSQTLPEAASASGSRRWTMAEETIRWATREAVIPVIFLPFPDAAIKGAQFLLRRKLGQSGPVAPSWARASVLARLILPGGRNYQEAMQRARRDGFHLSLP